MMYTYSSTVNPSTGININIPSPLNLEDTFILVSVNSPAVPTAKDSQSDTIHKPSVESEMITASPTPFLDSFLGSLNLNNADN